MHRVRNKEKCVNLETFKSYVNLEGGLRNLTAHDLGHDFLRFVGKEIWKGEVDWMISL